eukprot:149076_1
MEPLLSSITISEETRVFDLSTIDFPKYPKGTKLKLNAFRIDDITITFVVYPNGNASAKPNFCSVFMRVSASDTDQRQLMFSVQCCKSPRLRATTNFKTVTYNSKYSRGFINAFPIDVIKSSKLSFIVTLNHDPLFVWQKPSRSMQGHLVNLYRLAKHTGDITLIVKDARALNQDDSESYDLYVPSKKKQKTNHNNNNNNNNNGAPIRADGIICKIKASSLILRSASNVFERMLDPKNNMKEYREKKIVVYAHKQQDVHDMLYFMCTNELTEDSDALQLIHLAHLYELDRLFWICVNRLVKNVTVDNFVTTLHTFDRFEISKGYTTLITFAKDNIGQLKNAKDYLLLSHAFRCGILAVEQK